MLNSKPLDKLIFIDIETIPAEESFFALSLRKQELFLKRFKTDAEKLLNMLADDFDVESFKDNVELIPKLEKFYNNRAALHAEWNKVVVISIGYFNQPFPNDLKDLPSTQDLPFKVKAFSGTDEKKLLRPAVVFHTP